MVGDVINIFVGLVVGLLTGFYFEHRASASTRSQNAQLKRELDELKDTMYSIGATPRVEVRRDGPPADMVDDLRARALQMQDSKGAVAVHQLVAHFVALGADRREIDAAINRLCSTGAARLNGKTLELT